MWGLSKEHRSCSICAQLSEAQYENVNVAGSGILSGGGHSINAESGSTLEAASCTCSEAMKLVGPGRNSRT